MPRGRRTSYVRDANGRFASTPGGGGGLGAARSTATPGAARKAKDGAIKGRGTLAARSSLKASRAKLAPGASRQQKGAVTRASNKLNQAKQASVVRKAPMAGVLRGSAAKTAKRLPRKPVAAANPEKRKANVRAQKIKELINRTGTAKGKNFVDGKDVKTLSMKEMRTAVRQRARAAGVQTKSDFNRYFSREAGLIKKNPDGGPEVGRTPKTRGDWERLYKNLISVPQSDRGRKSRPGIVNGIDIQKNFRPWAVFNLNPKTATKADVEQAYRRVAKQVHPDAGGRAKDFERVKKMRDSVLAIMGTESGSKGSKGRSARRKEAAAPSRPTQRGPLMLPPAEAPQAQGMRRTRRSGKR